MNKKEILNLLMVLSALESWSFSAGQPLPGYLLDSLEIQIDMLTKLLLEERPE